MTIEYRPARPRLLGLVSRDLMPNKPNGFTIKADQLIITSPEKEAHVNAGLVILNLSRYLLGLVNEGYQNKAPSQYTEEIDKQIAQGCECPACKGKMTYLPFYNDFTLKYRAFAYCLFCNVGLEF